MDFAKVDKLMTLLKEKTTTFMMNKKPIILFLQNMFYWVVDLKI